MNSQTVPIELQERSYDIAIGSSLFDDSRSYAQLPAASHVLIVTNSTVAPLYAKRLERALQSKFAAIHMVVLPDGEEYKTWQTLNQIFDALLGNHCDRKTIVFALGGGVVGDMAGFAAA
ncbi:MAG: 3-dehydroquinate synthase, partial [Comamonadaceae bacterium]